MKTLGFVLHFPIQTFADLRHLQFELGHDDCFLSRLTTISGSQLASHSCVDSFFV